MTDPKLASLRAAIRRVAGNPLMCMSIHGCTPACKRMKRRFIVLWTARKRRTRVFMRRARKAGF